MFHINIYDKKMTSIIKRGVWDSLSGGTHMWNLNQNCKPLYHDHFFTMVYGALFLGSYKLRSDALKCSRGLLAVTCVKHLSPLQNRDVCVSADRRRFGRWLFLSHQEGVHFFAGVTSSSSLQYNIFHLNDHHKLQPSSFTHSILLGRHGGTVVSAVPS